MGGGQHGDTETLAWQGERPAQILCYSNSTLPTPAPWTARWEKRCFHCSHYPVCDTDNLDTPACLFSRRAQSKNRCILSQHREAGMKSPVLVKYHFWGVALKQPHPLAEDSPSSGLPLASAGFLLQLPKTHLGIYVPSFKTFIYFCQIYSMNTGLRGEVSSYCVCVCCVFLCIHTHTHTMVIGTSRGYACCLG